ncbi:MAG: TrmH family RNA methyltransferase [Kiritimatiellae bacterium]|nr:TrmH family RNA methyltransferase [Kiritimatiellia bacterium]
MPKPISEARAWGLALGRVSAIERFWDDAVARQREILACRHWLEAQTRLPHLCKLAALLDPGMDRRRLAAVLAPVERMAARRRVTDVNILERDAQAAPPATSPMELTLVADSLRSAFNTGGLFRTAECFGAAALWLCGYTADPGNAHVAEAALGAEHIVPWRRFERLAAALEQLRASNVQVVALETVAGAPAIERFAWRFPCAMLLGNERFGLDPETVRAADAVVRIPVYGRKNSLNVVSAAAIALHTARCAWTEMHVPLEPAVPAGLPLSGLGNRVAVPPGS